MIKAPARLALPALALALTAAAALAQSAEPLQPGPAVAPRIDPADTAWMLGATGLVLMMTIPGLALFYSGMVRKKNVLATMAQSLASTFVVSILWALLAYSLTFAGEGAVIGTLQRAFLIGMAPTSVSPNAPTIPESLFMIYQMTFAVITVALVAGSVADRLRFSAFVLFCVLWLFIVYVPIAHWVWGGGFLARAGTIDFAGGLVVHLNAGVAGLVAALVVGKRRGYGHDNLAPFDLSLAVIGTGLLWVGWFGFNGGSALAASPRAVSAIVSTHLAASAGACTWMALEWSMRGKPSVLGMISGAVAGLGTITPASGFVTPMEGVLIGVIAGGICFWSCTWLKIKCGYDDSLDVFGVHGVGGMTGTFLAGVLAVGAVSATPELPNGVRGLIEGNVSIVGSQLLGIAVTAVWSCVATWVILKIISAVVPLRVRTEDEVMGLDVSQHGEALQ